MDRRGIRRDERTPLEQRFWEKVEKTDGCWLWTGCIDAAGYGQVARGGKFGGHEKAHRVSWKLAHGPLESQVHVLHHCDTPACVRPDHLFTGDQLANMRDMWAKGRGRCDGAGRLGEANGNSRLTQEQAQAIYDRHQAGEPSRKLGREFGVSKTLVLFISKGRTWPSVNRSAA